MPVRRSCRSRNDGAIIPAAEASKSRTDCRLDKATLEAIARRAGEAQDEQLDDCHPHRLGFGARHLNLAATLCSTADEREHCPAEPVTATVSDQPARAVVTDTEPEDQAGQPTAGDRTQRGASAHIADAIDEIRRDQGNLLDGSVLGQVDAPDEGRAEFNAALQRVAREAEIAPVSPPEFQVVPSLVPAAPAPEGGSLLRQAARELDSRAADNEDLRQFEEADHLRRLSTQLRREARRWDERSAILGSAD